MSDSILKQLCAVVVRLDRTSQYAAAYRFNHCCLYWIFRPSAQLRTRRTMTTEYEAAISRRIASEVCLQLPALLFRGRREDRVLAAPAVSRAICA